MSGTTRIDRETKQRIFDAVDIVDVVSDFVTLKRRGANYIGLCPFHNERTPSFSVSKARGICKCFSCGKGGTAVSFLMELENMTFHEALRWLARKYNIEIKERELSDEERQQEAERESMLAVNDFAMKYFKKTLADTPDGRDIGLTYFRERGINEKSIERFHLGYSLERGDGLIKSAHDNGFSDKFLEMTGLCARSDRGLYDRFRGRVIYPVFSLSGRVVAFGGRTLRSDKSVAKYVNSPESIIYSKSRELYGLFQARRAIAKHDKCILVEGYMDVISMHQSGVENVVASSGTSLTEQQIRLIHRFTRNVTVIYDSDPAGIKASLRGIDMFLAQGLNVKVLLLPEGDDPDSFAQSHTSEEVERYIAENETDFIHFKSRVLFDESGSDPIKRARAISDILRSVSVIPDDITRQVYIEECARSFGMEDKILSLQVSKYMAQNTESEYRKQQQQEARDSIRDIVDVVPEQSQDATVAHPSGKRKPKESDAEVFVWKFERELLRYVVRYGTLYLCDAINEDGTQMPMSVYDYVENILACENISFSTPLHAELWNRVGELIRESWPGDYAAHEVRLESLKDELTRKGYDKIREEARDMSDIHGREVRLREEVEQTIDTERVEFARGYISRILSWDDDDAIRALVTELCSDRFVLSKVHTKYARVETEQDRLADLVPRAVYELKDSILTCEQNRIAQSLKVISDLPEPTGEDRATLESLMRQLMEIHAVRRELATYLGERIVTPRR